MIQDIRKIKSLHLEMRGTVQGVGFRPWVFRLAQKYDLKGFVRNTSQGACVEIEGLRENVDDFLLSLQSKTPAHCVITQCDSVDVTPHGFNRFEIITSRDSNEHEALVLPDIATCDECLDEIFDPHNRRYLYPFTNCTHCGPRYSIIESLPYDRKNTSMKKFILCPHCLAEYCDPFDRRFHAQPNACPVCGPQICLCDNKGKIVAGTSEAMSKTAELIRRGFVVAVKSLGGYHLFADALNSQAVSTLRLRKTRPDKPFAVMMPNLKETAVYCAISPLEEKLLSSPQAPIVLLRKKTGEGQVSQYVAPGNPYLGCMLPSMPLHHILMREFNGPVVATSGNLSEEPICFDDAEALSRLKNMADYFLVHDRPIVRQVDDSIVHIVSHRPLLLRRARGYAPLPVNIGHKVDKILAVGAHQKNTVALGVGHGIIISQHIGDLDNQISRVSFERTIRSLKSIYDAPIDLVAHDSHPDYASSRFAKSLGVKAIDIQHHHAHVASCMAENGLHTRVLGVCWDGTGWGPDGTIWGGEFLETDGLAFKRVAHLKMFALPGSEEAVKEPRRSALGLLFGICKGNWRPYLDLPSVRAFSAKELKILTKMMEQNINSPSTTSMGRLFDAVASLSGLCHQTTFEGQAAMALEFSILDDPELLPYDFVLNDHGDSQGVMIDWSEMVSGIIEDLREGRMSVVATKFHKTLVEIIVKVARRQGVTHVLLTGGCFQNKWLTEHAVDRLKLEGFNPYWHSQVPPNDGGIALGQIYLAARRRNNVSGNTW